MGIKKLKSEKEFLNMTIADMLAKVDPSKTKKYTQFLVRILEERLNSTLDDIKSILVKEQNTLFNTTKINKLLKPDSIENLMTKHFLTDYLFSDNQINDFISFCELMDKGVVEEKDISKYNSWDMMYDEYYKAKNRDLFKKSKKDILKIYEDERYLVFKPLTYWASVSYGYQTKWCTAMVTDSSYFYNYSRGILIYVIDKKENKKVAFHKHYPQPYELEDSISQTIFDVWNAEDKRIDSFQSGLPYEIVKIISMEMDTTIETNLPNYTFFSKEEKENMRNAGYNLESEIVESKVGIEDMNITFESNIIQHMNNFRPIIPIRTRNRFARRCTEGLNTELVPEPTTEIDYTEQGQIKNISVQNLVKHLSDEVLKVRSLEDDLP
jgi:hypothetical protein